MYDQMQPLPGSYREAPKDMRAAGLVGADEPITVSLYLKPAGAASELADRASMLAARCTEHGDDIGAVSAFGTELSHYEGGGQRCRTRHGTLLVPATLVDRILAVLGLDTRPHRQSP